MDGAKPLFVMGSKRSGSTFLVNALNTHPRIFVAHESDIIWILYQIHRGAPDRFRSYPLDEGKGMLATLDWCGELLRTFSVEAEDGTSKEALARAFYRVLEHINEHGRGGWDHPQRKRDLAWIGDKKPVQYSDPEVQSFIGDLLPEARFIHLVRNPRYIVASMVEAAETWGSQSIPEYWKRGPAEVLEEWATHEEWALRVKARLPDRVHTVRLEDLSEAPVSTMSGIFGFLGLELPPPTEEVIAEWAWKDPNRRHRDFELKISTRAGQLMREYGYED